MYYRARYYLPSLRRFISADTMVPGAGNPQHLNRYSYVVNNPIRFTDPTGHTEGSGWWDGSENHQACPWWENCGSGGSKASGGGSSDGDGSGGGGGSVCLNWWDCAEPAENNQDSTEPKEDHVGFDSSGILAATVNIWADGYMQAGEDEYYSQETGSMGTFVTVNDTVYLITHAHFVNMEACSRGFDCDLTIVGPNGQIYPDPDHVFGDWVIYQTPGMTISEFPREYLAILGTIPAEVSFEPVTVGTPVEYVISQNWNPNLSLSEGYDALTIGYSTVTYIGPDPGFPYVQVMEYDDTWPDVDLSIAGPEAAGHGATYQGNSGATVVTQNGVVGVIWGSHASGYDRAAQIPAYPFCDFPTAQGH